MPVVDIEVQSLPVESGELNWWPLSGPGPGIGDGSHSCGLYGWIALNGVGALCEFELYDMAETGVLA